MTATPALRRSRATMGATEPGLMPGLLWPTEQTRRPRRIRRRGALLCPFSTEKCYPCGP